MTGTLTVGSSFPAALNIAPEPKKDRDGNDIPVAPIWINPSFGTQEGVTTGVDAKAYRAWVKANPEHLAVVNGALRLLDGNIDHAWDTEPPESEAPLPTALPVIEQAAPEPVAKPAVRR